MVAELALSTPAGAVGSVAGVTVTVVNVDGTKQLTRASELRERIAAGKFVWIDIVGADEASRGVFLGELGFAQGSALSNYDAACVTILFQNTFLG